MEILLLLGNIYDVDLEFKILDENPGKKTLQTTKDRIGENVYYSVFTTQIEEELNLNSKYNLKEGDIAIATIRNTNLTLAQQMKDIFYTALGTDSNKLNTTQSTLVIATGTAIE